MHKLPIITAALLTVANASFAQSATDDEMRSLTTNILAGITGGAAEPADPGQVKNDALRGLVEQAISEGQSDAYLEALLSEAADKGEIEVPSEMRTTEGAVDTRVLLASLVAKSEGTEVAADTGALSAEAGAEAEAKQEDRFYVVKSGDSLAAIALTYYGKPQDFSRIFDANRDILDSPQLIRVGQKLIIPSG